MKRFIEGEDRYQSTLFPERLDDYIAEDNAVRVVDAFVEKLDLLRLGFDRVIPQDTGRPGYHPAMMLKLYIYGYLNRIQSSRRLEREAQRNVELIWLTGRLMPAFKTIADFRKDNREALCTVCLEFIELCRELQLFSGVLVAIDGSKFKAMNSRDNNYTSKSVKRPIKATQENIERYLAKLDDVDAEEPGIREVTATELRKKIASMEAKMDELKARQQEVAAHPDKQVSTTDPDCRSMMKPGGGSVVGYDVQTAVDEKHHLIVTHEVTNNTTDTHQLASMANRARKALKMKQLTVVADAGYYEGRNIVGCQEDGIMPLVPKPSTSNNKAAGLYDKTDFRYDGKADQYRCPAGEILPRRHSSEEKGKLYHYYYASPVTCRKCQLKSQCTTGKERRVRRWEQEAALEKAAAELKKRPAAMRQRKALAEHPYGTIKQLMGSTHFLMRRLPNVKAEMSLNVLAYNMKRAINVLGVHRIIREMRTA